MHAARVALLSASRAARKAATATSAASTRKPSNTSNSNNSSSNTAHVKTLTSELAEIATLLEAFPYTDFKNHHQQGEGMLGKSSSSSSEKLEENKEEEQQRRALENVYEHIFALAPAAVSLCETDTLLSCAIRALDISESIGWAPWIREESDNNNNSSSRKDSLDLTAFFAFWEIIFWMARYSDIETCAVLHYEYEDNQIKSNEKNPYSFLFPSSSSSSCDSGNHTQRQRNRTSLWNENPFASSSGAGGATLEVTRDTLLLTNGVVPLSCRRQCADGSLFSGLLRRFNAAFSAHLSSSTTSATLTTFINEIHDKKKKNNDKKMSTILIPPHVVEQVVSVLVENAHTLQFNLISDEVATFMSFLPPRLPNTYVKTRNAFSSGATDSNNNFDNAFALPLDWQSNQRLLQFVSLHSRNSPVKNGKEEQQERTTTTRTSSPFYIEDFFAALQLIRFLRPDVNSSKSNGTTDSLLSFSEEARLLGARLMIHFLLRSATTSTNSMNADDDSSSSSSNLLSPKPLDVYFYDYVLIESSSSSSFSLLPSKRVKGHENEQEEEEDAQEKEKEGRESSFSLTLLRVAQNNEEHRLLPVNLTRLALRELLLVYNDNNYCFGANTLSKAASSSSSFFFVSPKVAEELRLRVQQLNQHLEVALQRNANAENPLKLGYRALMPASSTSDERPSQEAKEVVQRIAQGDIESEEADLRQLARTNEIRCLRFAMNDNPIDFLQNALPIVEKCASSVHIEIELIKGKVKLLSHFKDNFESTQAIHDDLVQSLRTLVSIAPKQAKKKGSISSNGAAATANGIGSQLYRNSMDLEGSASAFEEMRMQELTSGLGASFEGILAHSILSLPSSISSSTSTSLTPTSIHQHTLPLWMSFVRLWTAIRHEQMHDSTPLTPPQIVLQTAHALVIAAICQSIPSNWCDIEEDKEEEKVASSNEEEGINSLSHRQRVDQIYTLLTAHKYHGVSLTQEILQPLLELFANAGDSRAFNLIDQSVLYCNNRIDLSAIALLFVTCSRAGDHFRAGTLFSLLRDSIPGFLLKAPPEVLQSLQELRVIENAPPSFFGKDVREAAEKKQSLKKENTKRDAEKQVPVAAGMETVKEIHDHEDYGDDDNDTNNDSKDGRREEGKEGNSFQQHDDDSPAAASRNLNKRSAEETAAQVKEGEAALAGMLVADVLGDEMDFGDYESEDQ